MLVRKWLGQGKYLLQIWKWAPSFSFEMKKYRNTLWCDNSHLLVAGNQIVSGGSTRAKRYGRPGKWARNSGKYWDTYKANKLGSFRLKFSIHTRLASLCMFLWFFPFASSVYTISLFSNILFAVYRSLPSATDYYLEYLLCCVGALSISLVICLNRETENVYLMIISCKIIFWGRWTWQRNKLH